MRLQAKPKGHQVHAFENYPTTPISRSRFNLSHHHLTTLNGGYIYPIYHKMAFPGDTMQMNATTFTRMMTQAVPFMDNVYMDVHFWAVPLRLLWKHWVNFMGEKDYENPTTEYLTPQLTTNVTTSEVTVGSIFDYFGIRPCITNLSFNAFNFRAYNLIYNEWYRDENLIDPVTVETGDTDLMANYELLKRGKRKDYFTGCLPAPQKGPAVDLPLGLTAPVHGIGLANGTSLSALNHYDTSGTMRSMYTTSTAGSVSNIGFDMTGTGAVSATNYPNIYADLSNATASTINTLRQAYALQRLYETDARGGTRYIEMNLAHFGVRSPDARLQRPEFLGGATFDLKMNAVPQTSATSGSNYLGNLASFGTIMGNSRNIVHSFTEHCVVIGLASIRADLTYQQGLDRSYSYRSRTDFYLPSLCNLGEQAVLNKEIFSQGASVLSGSDIVDNKVFGYQERWAEMRYAPSRISGHLRSDSPVSLDVWHLAQDFEDCPQLNEEFISENPPIDRVTAIAESSTTPSFVASFWFEDYWTRPMSVYSIPSMRSHF